MLVVLASVPLIFTCAVVCVAPPVKPAPVGAAQVNSVLAGTTPLVPLVGVTVNVTPVHVVVLIGVMMPTGLTVTVTVNVAPGPHATVLGVII